MQNLISTETSSQTEMACEQAALFGATPGPEEFDNHFLLVTPLHRMCTLKPKQN